MSKEDIIRIADKVIEYALYGLIVFIPISIAGVGILCPLAIVAFLVKTCLSPDFQFIKDNKLIYIFLLLFIIFMAMSLLNSGPYLIKGLRALFGKWMQYIFIFIIAADTFRKPKRARNAIVLMLCVLGIVVLSGYSQRFLGFEFLRNESDALGQGAIADVTSAFKNRNALAGYLVFFLALVLSVSVIRFKKKIYEFFASALVFLSGGVLLLTLSRGGWLGFFLGGFMLAAITKRYKLILLFLILFIVGIFSMSVLRERAMVAFGPSASSPISLVGESSDNGSAIGTSRFVGDPSRFAIWQAALAMIKENPFLGKGLGTFMDYFPQYTKDIGIFYTHNCYLQIWAESGIFSLLFFLSFVGFILCQAGSIAFINRQNNLGLILGGFVAGLFGFLIHSAFDNHLYSVQLKALFWLMLGMTQAICALVCGDRDESVR